jgi:hypothetical protein
MVWLRDGSIPLLFNGRGPAGLASLKELKIAYMEIVDFIGAIFEFLKKGGVAAPLIKDPLL